MVSFLKKHNIKIYVWKHNLLSFKWYQNCNILSIDVSRLFNAYDTHAGSDI